MRGRPKAILTPREIEFMHVFWRHAARGAPGLTATDVRADLLRHGRDLSSVRVHTMLRALLEKGFLADMGKAKPWHVRPDQFGNKSPRVERRLRARRPYEDVAGELLREFIDGVCGGDVARLRELLPE